jgi:molybdenum cofactor cytidylyltransferase
MPRHFAVLPAAGASLRMGRSKLLLPWGNGCLLEHVLSVWTSCNLDAVAITLPPDLHELVRIAAPFKVESIVPTSRPLDMKVSVLLALDRLKICEPDPLDAWLLAPADMPGITPEMIVQLCRCYDAAPGSVVVPVHAGRRGHPVVFPWSSGAAVAALPPDRGIDAIVKTGPVLEIPVDAAGLLDDLDTPEDYERLRGKYGLAASD